MEKTAAQYFEENHYVKIESFISKETASFTLPFMNVCSAKAEKNEKTANEKNNSFFNTNNGFYRIFLV